ncbi:SepA family multidrug efflux transporter [Staphylococcus caprae]|uniref:Multidrug resistance efflux pump SepA n=1 Tax=Staphylococcus caprae TaxID=29380 RepID=A0ABM7FP96_9STAP|nr:MULTISPECIES: SepA family multidrug efflux transporter [Staphylococcus]EES41941.1 multidrug resistance efflux pump SepA [Staphylococcus caprae M23864:W1]MBN6825954.1 SepA family multidrug efflux transporter [Staphylococcus caprae]MBU5272412.1 SepA family multidrug efflux transporter [Staphylococcus caprae]MBX5316383.1 SepA family multidrug efflux transporter [Staphylococcus caprae]MBX5323878.1 SepA family multidrug efflux transporter [Staphylococcus caprae]
MKSFKNKFYNLAVTLIVLAIFVLSGAIFLTFLGFGLYGLSRILIFFHLGYFEYNKGFYDNLFYYGSYIIFGYFTLFAIEHLMDYFKKKLPNNPYFQGITYHLISFIVTTIMFYFIVHIHYVYINIQFWVIMIIIGFLFVCKEIFYPESKNLNNKK